MIKDKGKIVMHVHVWRIGLDSSPRKTKKELLSMITKCGEKGYWLKNHEHKWSKELQSEGLITLCCEDEAATMV